MLIAVALYPWTRASTLKDSGKPHSLKGFVGNIHYGGWQRRRRCEGTISVLHYLPYKPRPREKTYLLKKA